MKCQKCNNDIVVDDISLTMSGYMDIDIECPNCHTIYWMKVTLNDFTSDFDLEEEQN